MNIELERKHIIEELKQVNEEWVLKVIKRILGLDENDEVSPYHKQVLYDRINSFESGNAHTISFDEAKKRLLIKENKQPCS